MKKILLTLLSTTGVWCAAAEVPSLIFLQYLHQQAPTLLCEQDARIQCLNMPTDLCQQAVMNSSERCGPMLQETWPASFEESQENAMRYANEYRQCILNDWVTQFGLDSQRLAACNLDVESP